MPRDNAPKSVHTIPATPGFFLWWIDDAAPDAWKGEPVVGWLVEEHLRNDGSAFYSHFPITPDAVIGTSYTQAYAIECPDGRIIVPDDITYDTSKQFLEILRARPKTRRELG